MRDISDITKEQIQERKKKRKAQMCADSIRRKCWDRINRGHASDMETALEQLRNLEPELFEWAALVEPDFVNNGGQ